MRLLYADPAPGASGFGWATCNAALEHELNRLCVLHFVRSNSSEVVFMPLADHNFNPATPARGKVNLAYTFFEYPLGPDAAANAAKYDTVFVGSTWCKERCAERGILNTETLIQGVDADIFKPQTNIDRTYAEMSGFVNANNGHPAQFRIFSGGKFEYRKGQDLVIAAFREFAKTHPEAHLVCSWFNPWPKLIWSCLHQSDLEIPGHSYTAQEALFRDILIYNGLRADQFTILPKLSQRDLAAAMANTDCGLFPNRCEGGTNLVLMEYLSCGRMAATNLMTGHGDLYGANIAEITASEDENHWAVQPLDCIVSALEAAWDCRGEPAPVPPVWSWRAAAEKIIASAERSMYPMRYVANDGGVGRTLHRAD